MTQKASVLAIATVFIGLRTLIPTFDIQRRGLIHETQEVKVQGGLMHEGWGRMGGRGLIRETRVKVQGGLMHGGAYG